MRLFLTCSFDLQQSGALDFSPLRLGAVRGLENSIPRQRIAPYRKCLLDGIFSRLAFLISCHKLVLPQPRIFVASHMHEPEANHLCEYYFR